jgi:hypothetical protein
MASGSLVEVGITSGILGTGVGSALGAPAVGPAQAVTRKAIRNKNMTRLIGNISFQVCRLEIERYFRYRIVERYRKRSRKATKRIVKRENFCQSWF